MTLNGAFYYSRPRDLNSSKTLLWRTSRTLTLLEGSNWRSYLSTSTRFPELSLNFFSKDLLEFSRLFTNYFIFESLMKAVCSSSRGPRISTIFWSWRASGLRFSYSKSMQMLVHLSLIDFLRFGSTLKRILCLWSLYFPDENQRSSAIIQPTLHWSTFVVYCCYTIISGAL